jgi:hypothetical protein
MRAPANLHIETSERKPTLALNATRFAPFLFRNLAVSVDRLLAWTATPGTRNREAESKPAQRNDKDILTNDKRELRLEGMNKGPSTKRSSTIFLQVVVVLIGIGALALMLWEPRLEGRNAHATLFETYFKDPFLAYAYLASIAFFVALFHVFTLLGYIRQNKVFTLNSVRALRTIKYCATALVAMIGAAVAYLFIAVRGKDDIAGGVAMGLFVMFVSVVIATAAAVFERLLQNVVDMKSENDLTV